MSLHLNILTSFMIFGVYGIRVHLFPFRTEKLRLIALMVLPFWGWESKSTPLFKTPNYSCSWGFLFLSFLIALMVLSAAGGWESKSTPSVIRLTPYISLYGASPPVSLKMDQGAKSKNHKYRIFSEKVDYGCSTFILIYIYVDLTFNLKYYTTAMHLFHGRISIYDTWL